jgi:glutamyl-tRNA synthetase
LISFFFANEVAFDPEAVEKTLRKPGALDKLTTLAARFEALDPWTVETIESTLKATAATLGVKTAELIHPTRVAVSGRSVGPSLYHMLEVMGRQCVIERMRKTVETFV